MMHPHFLSQKFRRGVRHYVLCDAYISVGLNHAVCATGIWKQNLCSLDYFTHAL